MYLQQLNCNYKGAFYVSFTIDLIIVSTAIHTPFHVMGLIVVGSQSDLRTD